MEVRLERYSRTIAIPINCDLLVNTKDVVLSLGLLCFNAEVRTLETFNHTALSSGIADLSLRVSFSIFLVSMPCIFSSSPFAS